MKDELKKKARNDDPCELELQGVVKSLSEWVELDAPSSVPVSQSVRQRGSYGDRLISLQSARRFLSVGIEDERRKGRPTGDLKHELETKRAETRTFLKYLEVHAHAHP